MLLCRIWFVTEEKTVSLRARAPQDPQTYILGCGRPASIHRGSYGAFVGTNSMILSIGSLEFRIGTELFTLWKEIGRGRAQSVISKQQSYIPTRQQSLQGPWAHPWNDTHKSQSSARSIPIVCQALKNVHKSQASCRSLAQSGTFWLLIPVPRLSAKLPRGMKGFYKGENPQWRESLNVLGSESRQAMKGSVAGK